ncbi:MAG: hypothetical protein FK730_06770 [Asgard group archaeon]|nr:hypothetical protein [Asgard group archaeon]
MTDQETTPDINLEDEFEDTEKSSIKTRWEYWKELQIMPNKKRFIILSVVFSIVELAGLFIIAYSFLGSFENGLYDFAIFLMAPFTGLAVSYFVVNQKEAIGISTINATTSIVISLVIFILVEHFLAFPVPFQFSPITHLGIPILFILIQIAVAFTMSRVRSLYQKYGDSSSVRESDQAMIDELKEDRERRGLKEFNEEEADK